MSKAYNRAAESIWSAPLKEAIEKRKAMGFTEEQGAAIEARGQNILVAAAAGSGKTRVLVERIIGRIINRECSIDELLVMTFTNAAAQEMKSRIEKALGEKLLEAEKENDAAAVEWLERQTVLLTDASISTFHVFCQRVIRQNIERTDIDPGYRLASEQEMLLLKGDVLDEVMEKCYHEPERDEYGADEEAYAAAYKKYENFLSFADAYGSDKGDDNIQKAVLRLYHFAQSQPFPEAWLKQQPQLFSKEAKAKSLSETRWGELFWDAVDEARRSLEEAVTSFEAWLGRAEAGEAEIAKAFAPYREVLQATLDTLEPILCAPQNYDALYTALQGFEAGRLSGAKKFALLRNNYEPLKNEFARRHEELKDAVKALKKNFFIETEPECLGSLRETHRTVEAYVALTLDFMAAFAEAKRERGVLDFNDLEHFALKILADEDTLSPAKAAPSDVALDLREKYKEVMVDEYQDTNNVQETILSLVAPERARFMVGDVKQSIYRFRLANPDIFQKKQKDFSQPGCEDGQLITMSKNFRSREEVLEPINVIFKELMTEKAAEIEYSDDARLNAGTKFEEEEHSLKGPLELDLIIDGGALEGGVSDQDEGAESEDLKGFEAEAQHIADRIERLMQEKPLVHQDDKHGTRPPYREIKYRDIAILLRAMQGKADILLETLRKKGIPAYADDSAGYFEAAEVALMLDLLRIIDNPRQDIPLAAVLASPIGGFSMEELARLCLSSDEEELYGALLTLGAEEELEGALAERFSKFQVRLSAWRRYAREHSVPELIWELYRETGFYDYVGALKGGLLRQANLRMLADRAADYEKTNYRGIFRFLRFIDGLKKRETDLSVARTLGESEDVVRIMSVHKSKGLEFPVVIMGDLGKGFNLRDTSESFLLHQELGIGAKLVRVSKAGRQSFKPLPWRLIAKQISHECKAEEMRVLYVALTRAQEKLILTGSIKAREMESLRAKLAADAGGEQFLAKTVQGAGSFLQWLLLAIWRRQERDGKGAEVLFSINPVSIPEPGTAAGAEDPVLSAVHSLQPLPMVEGEESVRSCLDWRYDHRGLSAIPSKATVTELKTRAQMEELSIPVGEYAPRSERELRRPRFMQETKAGLSASERGTLMHGILEHLDFTAEAKKEALAKELMRLKAAGFISEEELRYVDKAALLKTLASPLAELMRSAKAIHRELPFSLLLPAKRFYSEAEDESETIFLQGVLDLLLENEEGDFTLIDYKTDYDTEPTHLRARYHVQLELYAEAVQKILGKKPKKKYLFFVRTAELLPMP